MFQFGRKDQGVTIKILVERSHTTGLQRETVPGLALLQYLQDMFFLPVAAIEIPGQ